MSHRHDCHRRKHKKKRYHKRCHKHYDDCSKPGITRLEIKEIRDAYGGLSFGKSGKYVNIEAVAYGQLDPNDKRNKVILDLEYAPRNEYGLVEYSTDVSIAYPLGESNGVILHEFMNRGRKAIHRWMPDGPFPPAANDVADPVNAGNGFLVNDGYTMVWIAWDGSQSEVNNEGRMTNRLPVAKINGEYITGRTMEQTIFTNQAVPEFTAKLANPMVTLDKVDKDLTVRTFGNPDEPPGRELLPKSSWEIIDENTIKIQRALNQGISAIYEFSYEAYNYTKVTNQDGTVHKNGIMAVGYVAVRDTIEFLRYSKRKDNPLACKKFKSVISWGLSQPGRITRDFIYWGFNENSKGKKTFDGMYASVCGGFKGFVNFRFAKTGYFSSQHGIPRQQIGNQFPFAYNVLYDPISDKTDGILKRCLETNTCPKIIQQDSDDEWKTRHASLVVTDTEGNDIELPDNVRYYNIASSSHIPIGQWLAFSENLITVPSFFEGVVDLNYTSPLDNRNVNRALLDALKLWVNECIPPPPSKYGKVSDGTLITVDELNAKWPAMIPDFTFTGKVNQVRLTFPEVTNDPLNPFVVGDLYPIYLEDIDDVGNTLPGIRLPYVENPIGTYPGWNVFPPENSPGDIDENTSSWAPLTMEGGPDDSRPSLVDLYGVDAKDEWVARVEATGDQLVKDRYLLQADNNILLNDAKLQGFPFTT